MTKQKQMYVIAVDMGYGHQRAAYPFTDSGKHGIINANRYQGIPPREQKMWESGRKWYEIISRFKNVPFLGTTAFSIMDHFQKIEPFYPRRDLSKPSNQLAYYHKKIKAGLGKDLVKELNKKPLPLLSTFFVPAYFAEHHGYKGKIYCVICDADVARAWAPYYSSKSKITYLVPNRRVKARLKLYGVKESNILITGFPLPKENIGGPSQKIVKADMLDRLYHLDPKGTYRKKYAYMIEKYFGSGQKVKKPKRPLTITFAVGGAGAQRDIGVILLKKLHRHLKQGKIKLNLVAGVRNDVYLYFEDELKNCGLEGCSNVSIVYAEDKTSYFKVFNKILRKTDVLWTKPSELTFYSALGLPIIMSEPIGYQEQYNRGWLVAIGAGIDSLNPEYVDEWLFDWLDSGWLAEAAMEGFLDAPRMGTYRIENIVLHNKVSEIEDTELL